MLDGETELETESFDHDQAREAERLESKTVEVDTKGDLYLRCSSSFNGRVARGTKGP